MTTTITINGIDYSNYAVLPLSYSNLIDERLDTCFITLLNVTEKIFTAGSVVDITITDNTKTIQTTYLISNDTPTEIPIGSGKYRHALSLIEYTKELESVTCSSIAFRNPLGNEYTDDRWVVL